MTDTETDVPWFSPHAHTTLTPPDSGLFSLASMHMNATLYAVALEMR